MALLLTGLSCSSGFLFYGQQLAHQQSAVVDNPAEIYGLVHAVQQAHQAYVRLLLYVYAHCCSHSPVSIDSGSARLQNRYHYLHCPTVMAVMAATCGST